MRILLTLAFIVVLTGNATAFELGSTRPVDPKDPNNIFMDGASDREGGNDMASAVIIPALPFADEGATCDNTDDFDVACQYIGSTAPDVWYSYTPSADELVTVDLCGSGYDTKTYILDGSYNTIACNDDFYFDTTCGTFVSKIEDAFLTGGTIYYIVIDGYGGNCGSYTLSIEAFEPPPPCVLTCLGEAEGEPANGPGYVDEFNSGCAGAEGNFQPLLGDFFGNLTFCGVSGWIGNTTGIRDTDWFLVMFGENGVITWTVEAEQETFFFELGPQDCNYVGVRQSQLVAPCTQEVLVMTGAPETIAWIWVGPPEDYPPPGFQGWNYQYKMTFNGLWIPFTATEPTTFDSIKTMYR